MIVAAVFHIVRGEYSFLPVNLVRGGVAAFLGYGRLFVRPIDPRRSSPSAYLKGSRFSVRWSWSIFAPVWYKLTHSLITLQNKPTTPC
jgi:hypothetical protein